MGFSFKPADDKAVVGEAIAKVLPDYGKPWYRVNHLLRLNLMMIVPLLCGASTGYDGSLMNGLQSMEEWRSDFNHPKGTALGLINASQLIGGVAVLPFSGWLSDYGGRRVTLIVGLVGTVIATVIQATAKSVGQLIASRAVLGIFSMMAAQPAPLILAELCFPTHRGKYTSLYFTSYYVGAIVASWSCYGCTNRGDSWAWRIPTMLQAAFPIIQLAFFYFVPESPRWLINKGKVDKAREFFIEYHAGGDAEDPLVETEIIEIMNAIEAEKAANQTSWKSLIATPGNRKRTFIAVTLGLTSQWSGTGVISYYLTLVLDTIGITSSTTQTLINGFLQIFNLVFATAGAMSVDYLGRRFLFVWSAAGMLVSYVIWTACSAVFNQTGSTGAGKGVLAFIFIFMFHYDIAYTPLVMAYPTEIFPYSLRSKGLTVTLVVMFSSLLAAAFLNSIAMEAIGWKYYIVFCVVLFFVLLNNYFFYPETKGHSLEEIAILFDGEKAAIDLEDQLFQANDEKDIQVDHLEVASKTS